jgi:hypothetical protein
VVWADLGERNDGKETEDESKGSIPVKIVSNDTERDEKQENVQVGPKAKGVDGISPARFAFCLDE